MVEEVFRKWPKTRAKYQPMVENYDIYRVIMVPKKHKGVGFWV
jgi:hypothetical protein